MRYRVLAVLVFCLLAYEQAAFAWDDKVAHPRLTESAVVKSDLDKFLKSVLGIQEGIDAPFEYQGTRDTVNKRTIISMSVRSNNCLSSGLKSRAGNCPYTPVAQGSGV
jgi:hypothetical protein